MWLDNLKEAKKAKGLTTKQISDITMIPESTIKRIFSGDTDNPYVDTLRRIADALDTSLDHLFAESKLVVATETLIEVKENAEAVEAEKEVIEVKNDMLEAKITAMTMEIELLKKELQHKEELLALHNYYIKLKQNN
jgi:transcriptional regulator with XRE-family HTH domain